MNFEFFTASKIVFGGGSFGKLSDIAPQYGDKYLIVCGGSALERAGVLGRLEKQLTDIGVSFHYYKGVDCEPEIETVDKGLKIARDNNCDAIIAIGGGSVIDTAKAISGLITNEGSIIDYLEGVGKGKKLIKDPVPCIAIPTTSGTGSEVTKNAVISSRELKFKKSIRHEKLIPDVAIVDPVLTLTIPKKQTALSGMDALTQLIESYVTIKSNPLTDVLALYGMELVAGSLKSAYNDGANLPSRENMAMASMLSGICLANAGLGAVHGIAAPLGSFYGIPHGLACSVLLPYVMEYNMEHNINRYGKIGSVLTGRVFDDDREAAVAGIDYVRNLIKEIDIPSDFSSFNIKREDIVHIANASGGNSMNGNPVVMPVEDIVRLLEKLA